MAATAAGIAGVAGLVVAAPEASASIVGMQIVVGNTASNSNFLKRLEVTCPNTMVALGGDFTISGSNQVRIAEVFPLTNKVSFAAVEPLEGVSANWSLSGKAICAPQSSVPGYQRITGTDRAIVLEGGATQRVSTRDIGSSRYFCPEGKSMVGFGGKVDSGEFDFGGLHMSYVRLTRIQPLIGLAPPGQDIKVGEGVPRGFRIDGNGGGYDGTVGVTGVAICATGSQVTVDESLRVTASDSTSAKNVSRGCDNGTDTIISSGFSVLSDPGQNADFEVGITAVSVDRLTPQATSIGRESATGTSGNWLLGVYVVCTT